MELFSGSVFPAFSILYGIHFQVEPTITFLYSYVNCIPFNCASMATLALYLFAVTRWLLYLLGAYISATRCAR